MNLKQAIEQYPELGVLRDAMNQAMGARPFDAGVHARRKEAFQAACREVGVQFGNRSLGFGATDRRLEMSDDERVARNRAGVKRILREVEEEAVSK